MLVHKKKPGQANDDKIDEYVHMQCAFGTIVGKNGVACSILCGPLT